MKYLLIILLLTSCSKEIEVQQAPKCACATYYVDQYDDHWKLVNTFLSIEWNVCDSDLIRFEKYYADQMRQVGSRGYWICPPVRDFIRLEIVKGKCSQK